MELENTELEWHDASDIPHDNIAGPILLYRSGGFKYGLLYKLPEIGENGKVVRHFWQLSPETIKWAALVAPEVK